MENEEIVAALKDIFFHQRVLVTGGCGFIGSAVVRALYRHTPADIAILDKLTYSADIEALEEAYGMPRVQLHTFDLLEQSAVEELVATFCPTLILHLAAETHVDRSIRATDAGGQTADATLTIVPALQISPATLD